MIGAAITTIVLTISAANAYGASTRAEYVAQVEPICQAAAGPQGKAYYAKVKAGRRLYLQLAHGNPPDKAYNRYFKRAVKLIRLRRHFYVRETTMIAAVPPAPGDEGVVAQWLAKRSQSSSFLNRAIVAAHHHNFGRMARFEDLSGAAEADGEELVAEYGFRYCTPIASEL